MMAENGDVEAPSYEDWMKELHFVQTVKKATPKAVAKQPATEDKTTKLLDSVQSMLNENRRVQNRMDYAMGKTGLKTPETNLGWKGKSTLGFGGNVVETKRRNYVTGGEEKVYLTESGNEYGSRAMADVEQGQLDEARFMRENKRAYLMREKERIEREMNQRRGEVKRAEEEEYKKIWDGPLKYLSSMPRGGGVGFNPSADNLGVWGDKKYKTLNAQLKQVEDALATLDEAEAGKKSDAWIADSSNAWERNAKKLAGFGGGAWRGLAHSVGKIGTWDFGITDMETNKSVLDAANAVDKGTEATKEDQELLDLVAYKNMVEKESEPYLGYGYTAGSITGESLPFMLEMAINPASGVGKGAMKASMRGMLKKYGKEKLKSNFKKYLLAKAGARVAGDVAGAHAMALTTGQGRVIADTMRRLTGDVQYGVNDNGQIVYSGRKVDVDGLAEAYFKSFESQAIENHSEMLGEYFAPLLTRAGKAIGKPIGKGLEKLRLGGVNRFIEDVGASKTAKLIDDFSKKTQWNGSIGEYAEEVAGGIENAMIVGDQTLDTDEQTGVFNLEKNIETFLGVGLMGGFMFGAKLASYRGPKRGALQEMEAAGNRVDRALGGKMQARAQWGEWRSKLLLGNEEEKKNTLREIMDNEKLPIQFRNAVADFSRAAQKYEGLCRAEQSKRLEGSADPVGSSLDDAADAGYELNDPQEMTRTRLALENERERMAAYLGVEVDQVDATVGENLFDYVDNLRNQGVTGEELNRVMDYARARSRYEGMQMRLEDDTNTRIDNVHANMARYAHRENGTVQTGAVKTKDGSRPVWIVSGNLVFEGEGKNRGVNPVKSDESIFVIDAKTGQAEMHPATDFVSLGEPVSAEEVNAYYESSVREQMKKAFEANTHAELSEEKPAEDGELAPANETEGAAVEPAAENAAEPAKPAYEVGDVVTLETEDGPVSVEVQAVTADGVEVRTDEPWRGQVVQVIPTEEFEGMMKKPVVEAGVGEEESSAAESDHYTEGSPERVEAGDNLIVTDEEGNDRSLKVVRRVSMKPSEKGGLEPQEDANGKIVELVDDATGETVRMWDSELAERTKGYMRPQQGVMPSPKSAEGEGVEQAEQAAPAAEPAQPKRNEIPVDEKTGEPVYEAADPGAAWDALVEEAEGDEELAMEAVNSMVRDMEEKVKKAKNAKLRAGATAHEKMEAQKERKRHIAEAEERLESWKRIAGVKAERAAAAEASVVESSVSESPVVESPVAESPATVETPAAEEATPVQEGAQTPVQEGARGGVQVPHADSAGQEATQDSVTGAAPVAEQTGTTPKGVEAIPTRKNNKGEEEVLYHKVPVARTMADLYDGGMDQEEIDGFVEANSVEAAREVKRIEGKKPKMTTNKAKYMEAKRAWQAELDEAKEKEAYWKEVGKEVKRVTHRDEAPVSAEGRGHEAALGEDMPKDEPMDVYEVVASALGRGRIKITPESFRAETGYSVNDQKKYPGMVASAENGGVSVERAAEMLMEDADMAGFPSDDYTIRQAIIDVLQDGHPAGYISRRREEARRRAAERDEREREEYYQDRYGMNADDGMAYEETAVPNALNQYGSVSEDELAAQSAEAAEAAEAERMKREEDEQGNRAEDGGQQMEGKEEGAGNEAASEVEEMPAAHEPAVDSSMPKTSFTQDEAADFVDKMEARAESVPEMELTIENWDSLFGEDGRVETPIGEVKMGENQFAKLMRQGRNGKLGMIKPTLESPNIIIEQASMAKEGDVTERPSSYLFIKAFTKPDGERFYYFTSVSVSRDGKEVIISNQEKSRNKILRLMTEESVIWRTPNDAATSSAEKQGLDYAHPNNAEDETKGSGITPQSTSSAGKVTESKDTEQVGARDKAEDAKSAALTLAEVRELAKAAPSCELDRAGRERVFDFGEIEKEFGFDDSVLPSRRASVIESAVRAFADGEGERRSFEDFAQSYHREEFGPVIKDEELRRLYDLLSSRADRATSEQRAAEAKTEKYGEELMLERLRQIDGLTQEDIDRIYKELQALQLDMTDMNHAEETEHYLTESHLVRGMIQGVAMMEHELGKVREERAHGGAQAVGQGKVDNQGNPLNEDGSLKVEMVQSVDELTDEDFTNPSRNVQLPALPENIDNAIGVNGKPVVIKKNIFGRNAERHNDLTPAESREILLSALYNPDLYGQNQKRKRPYNWVVINTKDEKGHNRVVLLEVNENKDNVEIVHWHYLDERGLEKIRRQAANEDGQLLILPSEKTEEVGALSDPIHDLSSAGKVTESKETEQVGARVKAEGEEAEVSKDETPKEYKYRRNSDIDTLPDGYLRLGKDERGFDVAFYDHPLSRKEVERFHMGPITESNELVGKVYEVTRGLVTITYRVVGAEDGFVLFTENGSFDYRTLPYYKFMDWVVAKGKEVGTEVKASGKAREARAKDGTQPVSESEAGLRDALVDVARAAGVEVVTDSKEGQRVLDEVNGKARKMAFGEEYDYNQFPVGRVEPELLSRSVEIVPAERNHGFANYDEAKTWAKDHIVRTLTNEESGGKGRVKISGAAVGKYLSESAVAKSDNRDVHLAVLRVLPDVICKSIEVETTPDFKKDENGVRKAGNEINKDVLIHRCYGAVEIDGQVYRVKVTLKEYKDAVRDNKAYSYEATKIELLAGTLVGGNKSSNPGTNSSLSAAKLLNGVMMSYDSSKNVLDESAKMSALVREHRVYHGSGAEFEEFDHSHMGEGEGAQAYGWGTYVTEVEGIGRMYASQNKGRISYKGKSVQEIQKLYEEGVSPYNVVYSVVIEMEGGLDFSQAKEMLESDWRSSLEYEVAEGDGEYADGWRQNLSELASLEESDFSKKEGSHLYTVEIPNDNGSNYLHWEKPLTREQLSSVAEGLKAEGWIEAEGNHPTFTKNDNKIVLNERAAGSDVYAELEEAMGSQQKASEFLSSIGFTGVSMPAQFRSGGREDNSRNFVIFNEKDAQITDHVRFFKTENGEAYGFTVGGKVYLDPKIATTETAVHELTHLWADMLRKENPKEWKHVVELMKGTPVWDEVKAKYPELKTEDEIADEVLAHYSGRRGAERLRSEQQRLAREEGVSMLDRASAVAAIERVKDALNSFWKKVADLLGIHFKSAEEVADAALADILNGRVKLTAAEGMKEDRKELVAVHNITKDKLKQAMELGGFPMPSIAITKAGVGHTSFGDISLVFDKESINPTDKRNKVYGEDAWTPTFPTVGYKLDENKTRDVYSRANKVGELPLFNPVYFHPTNYEGGIDERGDASLVERFKEDYSAKQLYLSETGNAVQAYVQREVEKYSPQEVALFKKVLGEIGLERLKNGSFDDLKDEVKQFINQHYNIDLDSRKPIVAKMKIQKAIAHAIDYAENGNKETKIDFEATKAKIDERIDNKKFEQWLKELFSGVVKKRGIRNDREWFTPSGNQRKWEQLYDEITLDNVVNAMRKQAAKGGKGLFGGSIFGSAQEEYKSLDAIRQAAKERIQTINEEDYQAQREAITNRLSAIEIPGAGSGFSSIMDMTQYIQEAVAKSHTAKGIYKYLKKFYPRIAMETAEEIADIVQDIQHMSARYFEAKPYRAVGFDEVKLAVVPSDMDAALKERLEQMGIEVRTYASGDQAQRKRVVDEATEELRIRFQLVGEKGAANMDKAEEATTRLDNLSVAREMEEAFEEKKKRIEKLRKSDSVVVDGNEYLGKYELNSKSAGDYILSSLRRGYKNTDTNELIHISRKSQKVAHHDAENEVHLKSIAYIPQLIEHAIFIDEIPNSKSKNGFDSYRYYVVGFNIGGVDYTVRLTVGVKNGQSYYDHALTKIEKGNLLNLTDGVKADVSEKETAISDVKDKRLLSLLRMNEQENARKIKLATGWERGADGKWRYEVGDIGRMNFLGNARFIRNNPDAQRYGELNYKKLASLLIGGEKLTEEEEEEFSKLVKKFSGELDFNKKPMSKGNQLTLGDYFDADELFAAYPELEDVPVYAEQLEDGVLGYASEADSDFMGFGPVGFMNSLGKPVSSPYKIVVSQDFLEEAAKTLDESVKRRLQSVFIHEIQHLIQEIEGFAKGGSATTYRNHIDELKWGHDVWSWAMEFEAKHQELGKDASREDVYYELVNEFKEDGHEFGDGYAPSREVFDEAYKVWSRRGYDNGWYEAAYNEYQYLTGKFGLGFENNRYYQLAGEVEARNVQSRMDMTAEERRASLAEETEDVAREDQVFIMDGIESANSLGDNTSFENRQQRAVQERGVVPAGLNDASIKVEEIPAHPYEGRWSEARSAAIEDAYLKYSEEREVDGKKVREPKSLVYANHGRRFTYTISRGSLKESVNPKQIDKSKKGGASPGVHLAVLNHLDKVIANSIEVEEHPDYIKGKDGVRGPENGYTRGMLVHRFVGAVRIDGQEYIVKTTMHEHSRAEQGTRQYAYDVTKIAVLNVETPNTATGLTTATKGVLPLANVLNGFEKSYDPGKNLLEESKKEDRRFAESVGEQETDDDLYRNVFGGNSGYVGYSMSRRASKARSEGRFPKGDFKREYGLTDTMLNLLVENGAVSNSEWHHTSMFGNRTPFYGWEDYALEAFEEHTEELNRIARSRKLTASEKQEAVDKIMNESMDKKRAIEESAAGEQQRLESEYAVYRKEAESSQPARYEASNGAVVVKGTEGLEVYNSQGERLTKRNGKLERNAAIEEYYQKFAPAGFNQWMKDTHPEVDNSAYREVEQSELLDELRKASKEGRTVRVYRTMQVIDGKLYSPMAKKVAGQETSEIKFRWEAAEEHPELARRGDGSKAMPNEDSFYITIDKGQGKGALTVAYNPYTHTSRTVLNDQFSSAFVRPNLVVVEVEVPESELEGLYKAEKAKDSVGEMSWHSGAVSGKLAELGNPRKVILSRYDRPVRILTKKEEAELIAKQLEGTGIAMPYNLVTPQVREELEKLGVKIDEKPSGSVSKNASFGKAEYVTDEQIEAMNGRLQANAVSSPEAMTEAARALSEQLGVPVEIVTDVDSITHPNEAVEVKRRRAKGWYDKRTGKVAIVVPNHLDVEDVAATVFHEVVAHRGLRELVGEQGYDEFLMEVFNHSKADVRERMMALAGKHGWDIPKAVDEYLGGLAERGFGDFSEAERGMWTWLKEKVLEAIDKFIGTLKLPKSVKLGDNELRYLLWRSHENLRAGREGMVKRAMDVAKRYELGLLENEAGERMIDGLETYRSAENRGNTRALPIRERAKAVAHLKPVLVERNEMSKEELRQIYNALPDAVKDGRSISFFHSAFKKNYKEGGLFAQVLPKLNEILKGSVFAYSEKDNRGGEVRPDGTVHKYHPNANAFDNYVGKVEIDGKEYYVRITVQEQQGQVGTHSFFVTSVDVYEKPVNGLSVPNFPSGESDHQRVVDAKLRQFFDEARREDKASEEEDLYRTAYHEAAARDAYERRVKSGLYQSREALQDSMLGLRTAMEEVLKAEGSGYSGRVEDIPGFENAYLGENRLSSVNQAEVDEFGRRLFKPLLEIAASFGSSKEARQALTDYMMAKHGLERNALMRERAKKKAMEELEGDALQKKLDSIEKRDFAGLTALTGEKKVADAEQAARKMVSDFEQASGQNGAPNRIAELWKAVRGVTGATLKKMKDSGLITKEQFDEISGMYDFYIPLRGFDGQTAEDVYDYLGHGGNGSAFTSPIKKAEGRKSKADDPFAYMAAMAESAIMQGNRNVLVKQKFLNFVLNHPSDLVSVSDLWLRYDAAAGEWRVAQSGDIVGTEKLEEGDSPEEVERKMAVFEERMQAEAEAHPKEYKRQKEHPEIPYRVVEKQDLREHQVIVKRNGRDYVLTINGSPRAAQALNGLTNPNLDVSGVAGTLMNGVRNTTNYLSQVYTTRNPNFVGSNWVRDAVYSNIMAGLKEDKKYGLEFSKAWLEANPGSMSKLYYLYEHGELDMNNEKQRLFAEFMANGGETGYMSFRQIEERKNEIERQLKLYGGKMSLKKGWSDAWNLVDYANRVVENQSRFAAYMASRRSGRTIDRSIYDAKEITVNFNKKGAGSTFYNAKNQTLAGKVAGGVSGIGRFGFAFWNAAIQGTTNFARFVKRNPKKGVAVSLAMMAMGYAVPFIASLLHDDDDDKEGSGYFDLPDAVRRDNFVFRFPGMDSWITLPLPVEYRALYGMGELTATAMYRASTGMPMTAGEIAGQAMGQISQLMPLDLSEGGGMDFTWGASGNFNALAPSAVKPVAEAWTNKSWTGLPVYKDTPYNKQDPEWTKAFKNTNTFLVKMCKQLNEWTGGDSVKGGAVDLNPAVMEHLLKGYLGGIMQTANQIGKLGETVFGDRENEFRNWPVVSRFLQEGDERTKWRAVTERYFNLKKEAEETDRQLKRYKKLTELGEDHQADIDELIKTDAYKRMEVYDSFENDIQKIQDVLKRNDLSDEERKQVEGELNEIRLELLKAVDELGNLTGLGTGRLGAVTGDLLAE